MLFKDTIKLCISEGAFEEMKLAIDFNVRVLIQICHCLRKFSN